MLLRCAEARSALVLVLAGVSWGCSAAPRAEPDRPLPAGVAAYLLDPSPPAPAPEAAELADLFRRLLAGEPPASLRRELTAQAVPSVAAESSLLLAQIEFVDGDTEASRRLVEKALSHGAPGVPARLLAARLHELAGEKWAAFVGYGTLAAEVPVAAERRSVLREEALAELRSRLDRELEAGRAEAAAEDLARLREADPTSRSTLELQARVGAARGDERQELEAVRVLAERRPGDLTLALRRGELEVKAGDAGRGLALLEKLAAEHPGEESARATLAAAKFTYRLANAPEEIRRLARSPQLVRGDFARLLYWLVPAVRAARPGATRIATDLVDHAARDELVRVANLGLLRIDEVLHRFDPDRDLTRAEAFLALAKLAGERAEAAAEGCVYALGRHWIAEAGECLPAAPVTGAEATGWLRQADGSTPAGGSE